MRRVDCRHVCKRAACQPPSTKGGRGVVIIGNAAWPVCGRSPRIESTRCACACVVISSSGSRGSRYSCRSFSTLLVGKHKVPLPEFRVLRLRRHHRRRDHLLVSRADEAPPLPAVRLRQPLRDGPSDKSNAHSRVVTALPLSVRVSNGSTRNLSRALASSCNWAVSSVGGCRRIARSELRSRDRGGPSRGIERQQNLQVFGADVQTADVE